jgi:hypothetical protein
VAEVAALADNGVELVVERCGGNLGIGVGQNPTRAA